MFGVAQGGVGWSIPGGKTQVVLNDLTVSDALLIGRGA